jgi:DNA invertase Pin-like site-specific DNA recombinase
MPGANKFTIYVLAAVAEQEREAISRRTKDALAEIKQSSTPARRTRRGRVT